MAIYWIPERPDPSGSNGSHTRMAIDGAGTTHLLYVSDITLSLLHATGTPRQLFPVPGGGFHSGLFQWTLEDLGNARYSDPSFYSPEPYLNDLAIDSKGRLHLCLNNTEHLSNTEQLSHALFDASTGVFMISPVDKLKVAGLAMTIANDDSVHIAYETYSDSHGKSTLRYATHAMDNDPFVVTQVDHRSGNLSNPSIATGGGKVAISYINRVTTATGSAAFTLLYAEKTPTTGFTTEVADPGPGASGVPPNVIGALFADQGANSLVLSSDGSPLVAYFNAGLGIRCGRRASAAGSVWVRDALGRPGEPVDAAGQAMPLTICSIRTAFRISPIRRWARRERSSGSRREQTQVPGRPKRSMQDWTPDFPSRQHSIRTASCRSLTAPFRR